VTPAERQRRQRRQRRTALAVGLAATVVLAASLVGRAPADAQGDLVAKGRQLYLQGCVSCHGRDGEGVGRGSETRGPSLTMAGEAGAYYQLSTGRMPLNDPDQEPHRSEPAYDAAAIRALTAYVASLGEGPDLPVVALSGADLAEGGATFRSNCQACHSATGAGGALSYGRAAPSLGAAEREDIAAAVRAGPGQMPVFSPKTIDRRELRDLVAYVRYLRSPRDRGGLPIGRVGPVPEGFVAWSVGIVLLLACVYWIGTRSPIRRRRPGGHDDGVATTAGVSEQ